MLRTARPDSTHWLTAAGKECDHIATVPHVRNAGRPRCNVMIRTRFGSSVMAWPFLPFAFLVSHSSCSASGAPLRVTQIDGAKRPSYPLCVLGAQDKPTKGADLLGNLGFLCRAGALIDVSLSADDLAAKTVDVSRLLRLGCLLSHRWRATRPGPRGASPQSWPRRL